MISDGEDVVIQIAYGREGYMAVQNYDDLYIQLKNIGAKKYVDYKECLNILLFLRHMNFSKTNPNTISVLSEMVNIGQKSQDRGLKDYLYLNCLKEVVVICMVGKTGDYTLMNTFSKNNIIYFNAMHNPGVLVKEKFDNGYCDIIKIITAVRDPISHHISRLYEFISHMGDNSMCNARINSILSPIAEIALLKNKGDIQYVFDRYVSVSALRNDDIYTSVDDFINQLCQQMIDIKKVPFDKEKGCTIVKDGNVEVFVYQLEKMNNIVKEMAEFVGGDFAEWEMGNVASDKWIADSYQQAQKEIKFSQEYFDKCFSEPYVHHFYSEEDIGKFKDRWRPHIRGNN